MKASFPIWTSLLLGATLCVLSSCSHNSQPVDMEITNVSYDPTRELYADFNADFTKAWEEKTGKKVKVLMSNSGSGKQARKVVDGMQADVVTLALAYDIDMIAEKTGLLPDDWQAQLPHNSCPYTSTIVFLVRKGNPKKIKDWDDLIRSDVKVITPSPKTSGGARWNYLAAWGYALKRELGNLSKLYDPTQKEAVAKAEQKAQAFVAKLYKNVEVLDPSSRAATNTFIRGERGDVLLAWENEAFLAIRKLRSSKFKIVTPSVSILAEPPVAVIEKIAKKRGTFDVARAYLEHLYTKQGQCLIANRYYRPILPELVPKEDMKRFVDLDLFTVDEVFGGWEKAQQQHFNDGGTFDQIYQPE